MARWALLALLVGSTWLSLVALLRVDMLHRHMLGHLSLLLSLVLSLGLGLLLLLLMLLLLHLQLHHLQVRG